MIRIFFFMLLCLSSALIANAQNKPVTVSSSSAAVEGLPDSMRFRYPAFQKGFIHYKDGSAAHALFNLNLLIDEIQFIHPNGDTLSIVDEETVKYITIGKDSFLYRKGIIELLPGLNEVRLGKHQEIIVAARDKIGAYGESSGTTSITTFGSFYNNDRMYQLRINEHLLLEKKVAYYFIRKDYLSIVPATKANLLKIVKNDQLQGFIQQERIDFKKEADLVKLLLYVQDNQPGK